ncbi:MAG: heme exporter protein CcmD [Pseudomonadota bacterium]
MDQYAPYVWAAYAAAGLGLAFVAGYAVLRLRAAARRVAEEEKLSERTS